jgi:hypothetical protein
MAEIDTVTREIEKILGQAALPRRDRA